LIVITDAKTALGNMTLKQDHQPTRDRMLHKMKIASATKPVALTIDGHPTLQDELSGTENNTNVVFLHPRWTTATIFNKFLPGRTSRAGKYRINRYAKLPERFVVRNSGGSDRRSRNKRERHESPPKLDIQCPPLFIISDCVDCGRTEADTLSFRSLIVASTCAKTRITSIERFLC
jgi:hypothetical protein